MELAQLFCGTMKVKELLFGYRGRSLSYICWFVVYIYTALFRRRDRCGLKWEKVWKISKMILFLYFLLLGLFIAFNGILLRFLGPCLVRVYAWR